MKSWQRLIIPVLFSTLVLCASCLSNKSLRLSDHELFQLGSKQFNKKKFIKARETFTLLIDFYPDSQYSGEAQLLKADAFFREKNYIEAGVEYSLFLEFHPAHPKADYALYQEAECNYKHIKSIDRDQTNVLETIQKLKKLVSLYPASPFVPKAKERIAECQNLFHLHSLYVARFYARWGEYRSSIHRYQNLSETKPPPSNELAETIATELSVVRSKFYQYLSTLADKYYEKGRYAQASFGYAEIVKYFPDDKQRDRVLFRLATSHFQLKDYDKAKDYYQQLVDDFPQGEFYEKSVEKLQKIAEQSEEKLS
ncbi:outer membrane protein assembly factor BamD [candidate division CSSED10-310 bacterium]|uniref:Outer membrane protein assembly factor BamD n=1 Tax=candidate division CSSED10-310 bacterium TaxID=2855610 RepID=A0ABV6YRG1_UNCC1